MSINPPNPLIVEEIIQIFNSCGVAVDPNVVAANVAVFTHWLQNTRSGPKFMIELLKLEVREPKIIHQYFGEASNGRLTEPLKTDSIKFLRGCLVDGGPYPLNKLDIREREFQFCECCGYEVICVTRVLSPYNGKLEDVCEKCIQANNYKVDGYREFECESCPHFDCSWHPLNIDRPLEYG